MPEQKCEERGKPGFKWGESGKCYTYTSGDKRSQEMARRKMNKQRKAIEMNKERRG